MPELHYGQDKEQLSSSGSMCCGDRRAPEKAWREKLNKSVIYALLIYADIQIAILH